jgi:hypothetical protein
MPSPWTQFHHCTQVSWNEICNFLNFQSINKLHFICVIISNSLCYINCIYYYLLLHRVESFLRIQSVLSQSRISPYFMEPEGSLLHSQLPGIFPYPEPDRSSPYPHIPIPANTPYFILPSLPGSSKWSLSPRISPPKHCVHLSYPPYVLHAPPITLNYIVHKLKCSVWYKFVTFAI